MVNEAPGPINFTMFLTLFGEKLTGTDPEEVDELFRDAPIKNGRFDYVEFTRMLKHGTKDKDDTN
uniref:Myosin regulatory light chain n=1 Tax=Parascaris equorum TaxID=6256 RepID=A0A914RYK0_PAREQ